MKLVSPVILIMCSILEIKAQKLPDQFVFPPQLQTPHPGMFSSSSSIYLPPESHTPIPFFPKNNVKHLPFPYLPPSETKGSAIYPTPFPLLIASSLMPNFEDDQNDEDNDDEHNKIRSTSPKPNFQQNQSNYTENVQKQEKREMRALPKMVNYENPIDRIDLKFTPQSHSTSSPINQTPASRRMIISAETHRNDQAIDQIRAASSFPGPQFFPAPGVSSVFISSATEPAIPIIRLSNEMDLDGSFSYEALGADQTHYVQHSRMENMGTDKEEQVVEGSYSYVGDNGHTYTVHYIADSNGFRASGDHLPVAPPVPEIIQRAVQYNLAEEAKKPPHLKSWQAEEKDTESEGSNNYPISPPRNLFTGRTPEAFSYSFAQGSNTQNNLAAAASSQVPVKTVDFSADISKMKTNGGPIAPQITFLASQGAHVPSMNMAQQSIARMLTSEKSTMPQLVNYEADHKETDTENSKALWRWQYGLNTNKDNQNINKNTISRSSGEGDDVMINFSDMTPEQYTKMIQSEVDSNNESRDFQYRDDQQSTGAQTNYIINNFNQGMTDAPIDYQSTPSNNQNIIDNSKTKSNIYYNKYPNEQTGTGSPYSTQKNNIHNYNEISNEKSQKQSTEAPVSVPVVNDWLQKNYHIEHSFNSDFNNGEEGDKIPATEYYQKKLVTYKNFVPPSQTVRKSYDYEDKFYEPRKVKSLNMEISTAYTLPINSFDKNMDNGSRSNNNIVLQQEKISTTQEPLSVTTINNIKFTDFITREGKQLFAVQEHQNLNEGNSFQESNLESNDNLKNNIFLKNIFKPSLKDNTDTNINENSEKKYPSKVHADAKADKIPKYIQFQSKPQNEIKVLRKKPVDMSDILNYITMKNQFESSKTKANKNKPIVSTEHNQKNEMYFKTNQQESKGDEYENKQSLSANNFRPINHHQEEELRGIIKNYKVLHRNNNVLNFDHDSRNQFKRDTIPPAMKTLQSANLPPLGRAGPSMKTYLPPIYV